VDWQRRDMTVLAVPVNDQSFKKIPVIYTQLKGRSGGSSQLRAGT
jgi:hypothetical protein